MEKYEYEPKKRVWGHILEDKAKKNGDKVYVYFEDQQVTYKQMNERANRLANGYASLGIKKGDKVSALMPNCLEFLYHWFALAKLGAVDNPINTAYKGDTLKHVIRNSDSHYIVIDEQFLDRLEFVQNELPDMKAAVIVSKAKAIPAHKLKMPVHNFDDLMKSSPDFTPKAEVKPADPYQIIYTSGTTGLSKGVVLSHHCVYIYAVDRITQMGWDENTRVYNCMPLFHQNHRFTTTYTMLLNGAYALGVRYSARAFWGEIKKYNCNAFHFLGAMLGFIYGQPPQPDDGDNPVKIAWGGPINLEIAEAVEKRFNLELFCGVYGLTECASITSLSAAEARKLKAQGKWDQALGCGKEQKDMFEVRLVDDDDEPVPDGTPGEIICRPSRNYSMMSEYINNPAATAAVARNFWFHTGDLAVKDKDGFFHFSDRKKDYLRRRGENISSFEVEQVVNVHPSVLESAVIGAKSELGEDEIRVVIQLKPGKTLTPIELMEWCEPRMPYFMVPRFVDFLADFPRSPVGRVEKYKLRELKFEDTWDREKAGYTVKR